MIRWLRCIICEKLIKWALDIAPDDYTPSCVEACVDAYKHTGMFEKAKIT